MKLRDLIPTIESLSEEQIQELLGLAHDAKEELEIRKDKNFISSIPNYDEEVQKAYKEGYKKGLTWPEEWNYRPGGPHYFRAHAHEDVQWKQKCRLSQDIHKAWLRGWDAGKKEQDKRKANSK